MPLGDASIFVNGVDVSLIGSGLVQWGGTWEERIDGVGVASLVIQDRPPFSDVVYGLGTDFSYVENGVPVISNGWRDIIKITLPGSSLNLYWGEITNSVLDLPVGAQIRRWNVTGSDFNTVMDLRLVGFPDGNTWTSVDGGLTHTAIDPFAVGLSTDGATVTQLFDHYAWLPDFVGVTNFDATTFVHDWIPTADLIDPLTGQSRLLWTNNTLRGALDELRGLAGFPVFCWIDPDLAVHWDAFGDWSTVGGGSSPLFPYSPYPRAAPARITDVQGDINGTTVIGGRLLKFPLDATYMPQQVAVTGVTDYIHNADGSTTMQGTGWHTRLSGRHDAIPTNRQVLVDAQAVTPAQRAGVIAAYVQYAKRARLRGTVTVGSPTEPVDGWRVGQLLQIHDSRLPSVFQDMTYPILRVQGKQVPGQQWREYILEFGDAPVARFSQKYRTTPQKLATARLPAKSMVIEWPTRALRPGTSYTLVAQLVDHSRKPVRHTGLPVDWSLTVLDASGVNVGGGSLSPVSTTTDGNGRVAAVLTTGATTGLHYHVKAVTTAQL